MSEKLWRRDMAGHARYDIDDVPDHIHYMVRGGWGLVAPQVFGIAHFIPEMQFSGRAACADTDPDCFFPETGKWGELAIARRICAGCPIKVECLAWALKNREAHGVWGGTTYRERQHIWVRQQRKELQ